MPKRFFTLLFLLVFAAFAKGQTLDSIRQADKMISKDSLNMQDTTNFPDRSKSKKKMKEEEPVVYKDSTRLALEKLTRTAVRKSAIIPGWGQLQNGRWWKVPLVAGGFVGVGLVFEFNQRYYKIFLEEAQFRTENPNQFLNEEYAHINSQYIIQIKDYHRRNRDLSVLAGLGFYAIQLIDAYVDSKFFRYDMSDDFAIKLMPSLQPTALAYRSYPAAIGLKMTFQLR